MAANDGSATAQDGSRALEQCTRRTPKTVMTSHRSVVWSTTPLYGRTEGEAQPRSAVQRLDGGRDRV